MRRIVVTGANKGIGRALVGEILAQHEDTFVFLGARSAERGEAARAELVERQPGWAERVEVLPLDVASDDSVARAAEHVAKACGEEPPPLYGIVNNAGVGAGSSLEEVLEVNTLGVHRVCSAFLPLLQPKGGRIVNVTSAAGPNFVHTCSPERQRFFLDHTLEWPELESFIREAIALGNDKNAFAREGLGDGNPYGLSKACTNTYTLILARENPSLRVNACTPGFIETDMTRPYLESSGKSAAEMGMKTPAQGTVSAMFLLFGEPEGNGRYYGSDAERSPLDRYRSPGTAPYTGD